MSLPESKAILLKKFVNNFCELCHKKKQDSDLQIHRLRRGSEGGLYQIRNCMVLCRDCHKLIHGKEFNG